VVILTNNCESLRYKVRALYGLIDTNQARVVVFDVPTRTLTGQHVIASDGYGARSDLS